MTVRAPAKVNLHLGVGQLRTDGYHDLTSVFLALSLHDELTAEPATTLTVTVTGEGAATVPTDDRNLAMRAARALAAYARVPAHARLSIRKGIPVAGGMAGGSADAAAALVACDALWRTDVGGQTLRDLAAELGSDVPFALHGGIALGVGRGERLTEVLARGSFSWVVALADGGLSTPQVYAELDRLRASGPPRVVSDPDAVLAALRTGDPVRLGRALGNDLQPAALRLRPALRRTLAAGREAGALGGLVSGSGPTCAFLVRDPDEAVAVAARLAGDGVCRSVRTAVGPVPGARVVRVG